MRPDVETLAGKAMAVNNLLVGLSVDDGLGVLIGGISALTYRVGVDYGLEYAREMNRDIINVLTNTWGAMEEKIQEARNATENPNP